MIGREKWYIGGRTQGGEERYFQLEAVRAMKETSHLPAPSLRVPRRPSSEEFKSFYELAKSEQPHDPPLHAACLEGKHSYIEFPLSILNTRSYSQ